MESGEALRGCGWLVERLMSGLAHGKKASRHCQPGLSEALDSAILPRSFYDPLPCDLHGIEEARGNGAPRSRRRRIRAQPSRVHVVLGVSNISFWSLSSATRIVLNSVFSARVLQRRS